MNWDGNVDITDHELHAQVTDLARRLDALEADNTAIKKRQRLQQVHDQNCTKRTLYAAIRGGNYDNVPKEWPPCDCWLSREEEQ